MDRLRSTLPALALCLLLSGCAGTGQSLAYYWQSARGHLQLMNAAEPIDDWLARALAELMPSIHLTRSPSYVAAPPSPDFADNYGYGVICGPDDGPPALLNDPQISFGLMLLGPETHYPLHSHPADEIYYTVTGPSSWRVAQEPWSPRKAGEIIHHPSWIPHATLAADRPLVLLYVWQGDLQTDASFVADWMAAGTSSTTQGSHNQ